MVEKKEDIIKEQDLECLAVTEAVNMLGKQLGGFTIEKVERIKTVSDPKNPCKIFAATNLLRSDDTTREYIEDMVTDNIKATAPGSLFETTKQGRNCIYELGGEGIVHGEVLSFWEGRCKDVLELLDELFRVPKGEPTENEQRSYTREVIEITYGCGKKEMAWTY